MAIRDVLRTKSRNKKEANGEKSYLAQVFRPPVHLRLIWWIAKMVRLLDVLLVVLGAALAIVGLVLFKGTHNKASRARNLPYAVPRRRRFMPFSMSVVSSLILFLAALFYFSRPYFPQLQGFVSKTSEGCAIKGNISTSGERIYHLPFNAYYADTHIDLSRDERWFCSESEALRAGWRPAKV
jgi:hypothetical protein